MDEFAQMVLRDMHLLSVKNIAWALNAASGLQDPSSLFLAAAQRLREVTAPAGPHGRAAADGVWLPGR